MENENENENENKANSTDLENVSGGGIFQYRKGKKIAIAAGNLFVEDPESGASIAGGFNFRGMKELVEINDILHRAREIASGSDAYTKQKYREEMKKIDDAKYLLKRKKES